MVAINHVSIDLDAIEHNYHVIRHLVKKNIRILGVVKADAYGHGLVPVSLRLAKAGIDCLGVFEIDEGILLRNAGINIPILVMMGITHDDINDTVKYNLTPFIYRIDILRLLSRTSLKKGNMTPIHLKVDTGMTRLGIDMKDITLFINEIKENKGIRLEGIGSHLSVADIPGHPFTEKQIKRFQKLIQIAKAAGFKDTVFHIDSSGAVLDTKSCSIPNENSMVRPGLLLYGCAPNEHIKGVQTLKQAMTFKTEIISIREVVPNIPIGYGCTYVTNARRLIATIPVGYDDGYSRLLSNNAEALVHNKRVPVVGTVCMNMTMLDVSHIRDVKIGDEVILVGSQGSEEITLTELADKAGTISYEVMCSIGKSNKRIYSSGKKLDLNLGTDLERK